MLTADQNIVYQQNLKNRSLGLVVLGSNIWPIVREHASAIRSRVSTAKPGSYAFIEMPLPPKNGKVGESGEFGYPRLHSFKLIATPSRSGKIVVKNSGMA